jgi:2Fe-2S ferredoxin
MTSVTYVEHDGTEHTVDVPNGSTVMHGALNNNIQGIVAECGGGLACATCHCYVADAWADKVGTPTSDAESEMLDSVAAERKATSRLSCQITISDELNGLVVHLPERQF